MEVFDICAAKRRRDLRRRAWVRFLQRMAEIFPKEKRIPSLDGHKNAALHVQGHKSTQPAPYLSLETRGVSSAALAAQRCLHVRWCMNETGQFPAHGNVRTFQCDGGCGEEGISRDVLNIGVELIKEASKPAVRWLWKRCLHARRRMGETG